MAHAPKHVVLVAYDGVAALGLAAPLEAFKSTFLRDAHGKPVPGYRITIAGLDKKTFRDESGLRFTTKHLLSSVRDIDTLMVPGGCGLREPRTNRKVAAWISRHVHEIRRVTSTCTGVYGIAPTGLLKSRNVATHWRFCGDLSALYPDLKVDRDALYVRDGKFYTSAGSTASFDLSLALIQEDYGPRVALAVARELVVFVIRPGGQEQYSEPLQFQAQCASRFADLAAWMVAHLNGDLSVEVLAARVCLSPRQFTRRFTSEFKASPAEFVRRLRLDEARKRLCGTGSSVKGIATSLGFANADSFGRAFEQRFGVTPTEYRGRFVAGK